MTAPAVVRPPAGLWSDRAFLGLNATQFLGAFNDNLFKQLVLLLCVDYEIRTKQNYQGLATILFAVPFIAFSGFAGYLSDRFSKPYIITLCKLAEIGIVAAGLLSFLSHTIEGPLFVLFLMGIHSAFFGPPKYGVLPELLRESNLPRANGSILMTTFLAIIFGFAAAGKIKDLAGDQLWLASSACLLVAVLGTLTSMLLRKLPPAQPSLRLKPSSLIIDRETVAMLQGNRSLLGVLLMSSVFWFVGGTVYPPAVNDLGKQQMHIGDAYTGYLAASTGVGIAIGCVAAGWLSQRQVRGWLVRVGAWGICASLSVISIPGSQLGGTLLGYGGTAAALVCVGFFAGLYSVPLQVYLQAATPAAQKGRIIAAMNLLNWIGIAGSGVVYMISAAIADKAGWPRSSLFVMAAVLLLPVAIFYRPPNLLMREPEEEVQAV